MLGCELATHNVPANRSEFNEAPRRLAHKPHADLHAKTFAWFCDVEW
jgi:hypothetical protein